MSTVENTAVTEATSDQLDQVDALLNGEDLQDPQDESKPDQETKDLPERDDGDESGSPARDSDDESPDTDEVDEDDPDIEDEDDGPDPDEDKPEIDYDLKIPMPDGREAMTIGQLKDLANNVQRERSDIDAMRMQVIQREQELNQYMQRMNVKPTPEFAQHMQRQQAQHLQQQHELMTKMVPETATKTGFEKLKKDIYKSAARSNFSPQEIEQISDARIVHLLNRLVKLEANEAQARETVKEIKAKPKARQSAVERRINGSRSSLDKQVKRAIESNDVSFKDDVVSQLINSG